MGGCYGRIKAKGDGHMSRVLDNFLRYVKIDTKSKENVEALPSTECQLELLSLLRDELIELGVPEVRMEKEGYVYAMIPGNVDAPVLGFMAHADTSPAFSGTDVKPCIRVYQGGKHRIGDSGLYLTEEDFPELKNYIGEEIITASGDTLLGADDKAGVAEIMAMAATLMEHPEIPHPPIAIAFTPDEEVGGGMDAFSTKSFGADFAYTVDGGELGEIECENFNAANFRLRIHGKSVHPGSAKNKMKNAVRMAQYFMSLFGEHDTPEHTEGYEGFYHFDTIQGNVSFVEIEFIVRDFDRDGFDERIAYLKKAVALMKARFGEECFELLEGAGYRNMREIIDKVPHLKDRAEQAMKNLGIVPKVHPIRGGTDGARLSYMGIPCPNLSTGGFGFHGPYEWIPVSSLERMVDVLLEIIHIYATNPVLEDEGDED